jgi:hypothetical protein
MSDDPVGGWRASSQLVRYVRGFWGRLIDARGITSIADSISQAAGRCAAAARLAFSLRPAHQKDDRSWMRRTDYTDSLTDDEYRDFLRSCGHTAARIERRDFLDDEEPDLDLLAEPQSYQRAAEKSPDGAPADTPESGPTATRGKSPTTPSLTPAARAIGAAYQLRREGKPVSLRAACALERIDRANLKKNYPEAVDAIEAMATPDRSKPRGIRDARTGRQDGVDDPDARLKSGHRRSKPIEDHDAGDEDF